MTTIVSANIGGYDEPHPHVEQTIPVTWVTVTEGDDRHPRMTAKEPKLRPWDYSDDGPWIWLDAAFQIVAPTFAADAVAATKSRVGQWDHPWRNCVYTEADEVVNLSRQQDAKYTGYPARAQADHYRLCGHPERWGLWATGLIVYTEPCEYLAALWWAELNEWGYQDQISQPVALRRAGMRPTSLPGGLHRSPWVQWHPHNSRR